MNQWTWSFDTNGTMILLNPNELKELQEILEVAVSAVPISEGLWRKVMDARRDNLCKIEQS